MPSTGTRATGPGNSARDRRWAWPWMMSSAPCC
jgi:hypothetical protein